MMKMNAGAWIGIIGGIIGLLIGVIAVVATGGSTGIYVGLGMLVLFGGMFYLFYRLFFKPMINAARLQKTGIPANARILSVKDTGVTINNNPQVKLMLEIRNQLGQRYNAECRVLVSRLNPNAYKPGMEIAVKVDPNNEQNVVPDFGSTNSFTAVTSPPVSPQINETTIKSGIEQVQKENEAISISGKSARAIIKKHTWLGVNVNGNNPYVELELEILPDQYPAFSGRTRAVIAETSVSKYQPGQQILVKYDLYDNSKAVIIQEG